MQNNINPNLTISFGARKNLKKILPQVRDAINQTMPGIESPQKLMRDETVEAAYLKDVNNKLGFLRAFIKTLYSDGGLPEHFRGLISLVRGFKVANCDELAEITKTVLKANNIKNSDIFSLAARNPRTKEPPRPLDHVITAINVPKYKNNKVTGEPFVPSPSTRIIDMWLDNGYVGTIKYAKKRYKIFGLKPGEQLMLCPMKTLEPDTEALKAVRKEFPTLILKKEK